MMNFIPYARQTIDEKDIEAVGSAMRNDYITRGPAVEAFEKEVAQYVGARHAVAFSNGSAALLAAYQAVGVTSSDMLVTSPNTFAATASGALRLGAKLHLVDIDSYGNIDLDLLEGVLHRRTSRGRLIIVPVHFAGVAVDMNRLQRMICHPDVVVIEDGAHAFGSSYPDGQMVGSCAYSDMTVFSFHAIKNITCGEGGVVSTNDDSFAHLLRLFRNSGLGKRGAEVLSCNAHMTEMQAALGLSQLGKIDCFARKKQMLLEQYRRALQMPALSLASDGVDSRTHYHLLVAKIEFDLLEKTREAVMEHLYSLGIGTQYHYFPLYRQKAVEPFCGQKSEEFPNMESHFLRALSLPFFSGMDPDGVDRVISGLKQALYE